MLAIKSDGKGWDCMVGHGHTQKNLKLRGSQLWRLDERESVHFLFLPLSIPYFLGPLIVNVLLLCVECVFEG